MSRLCSFKIRKFGRTLMAIFCAFYKTFIYCIYKNIPYDSNRHKQTRSLHFQYNYTSETCIDQFSSFVKRLMYLTYLIYALKFN